MPAGFGFGLRRRFGSMASSGFGATPRGTFDYLPERMEELRRVESAARQVVELRGYREIATPTLELAALFEKSLGATSDVVGKEMYRLKTGGKRGQSLTLRPEGTAPVMRAVVGNGMLQSLPQLLYYSGPMFRHERPQKNRYRQFHQFGIECVGPSAPEADAEIIESAAAFLNSVGLREGIELHLNTLGNAESLGRYQWMLQQHFQDWLSSGQKLSIESKTRLKNRAPLRILDSKDVDDKEAILRAPLITRDALSDDCLARMERVENCLDALGVPFLRNPRLVRGLDYYSHSVFEFVDKASGAAVLAGGRYDGLAKHLGHKRAIPAAGWAAGLDRIISSLKEQGRESTVRPTPFFVLPALSSTDPAALLSPADGRVIAHAMRTAATLRASGFETQVIHGRKLAKAMGHASKKGALAVIIVGKADIDSGVVTLKVLDRDAGGAQQQHVHADDLPRAVASIASSYRTNKTRTSF